MTESVSKEFAQSKNGLLHHGLTGLTGQLSCLSSGLLQCFSEANRQPPGDRVSWYVVTTRYSLYSLYSYFSWGAEHFEQGLPAVHAPSTHPEHHDLAPSHTCAGSNPCCLPLESIHKEVLNAPPTPFSAGTVICLSWDTQYYVILIFRWTMTMKKIRRKRFT